MNTSNDLKAAIIRRRKRRARRKRILVGSVSMMLVLLAICTLIVAVKSNGEVYASGGTTDITGEAPKTTAHEATSESASQITQPATKATEAVTETLAPVQTTQAATKATVSQTTKAAQSVTNSNTSNSTKSTTQAATKSTQTSNKSTQSSGKSYKISGFKWVNQYPELPTGCEITALTSVLNYYGYNVKKETMADDYLKKGSGSFYEMFLGNPRKKEGSYGCMAQPIADAANLYFKKNSISRKAVNISGSEFDKVLDYVAEGYPVIVWNTINMKPAYESKKLVLGGKTYTWIAPEHCVVVIGFDRDANEVYVADPTSGLVTRNLSTFKQRYNSLKKQAVYITK